MLNNLQREFSFNWFLVAKLCKQSGFKLLCAQQHRFFTSWTLCKPDHIIQFYMCKIHFNITLFSILITCKKPPTVEFRDQNFVWRTLLAVYRVRTLLLLHWTFPTQMADAILYQCTDTRCVARPNGEVIPALLTQRYSVSTTNKIINLLAPDLFFKF